MNFVDIIDFKGFFKLYWLFVALKNTSFVFVFDISNT